MLPSLVVREFHLAIDRRLQAHDDLVDALKGRPREQSLHSILAEQCAMSIGVQWEAFATEIMVAHVVLSPRRCIEDLRDRVFHSVEQKFGYAVARRQTLNFPAALSESQALALLDPKAYNIPSTTEEFKKKANQVLDARHAIKFSLAQPDAEFIEYLVALRNFIAHGSPSSRERLKASVAALAGSNGPLNSSTSNLGSYLKAKSGTRQRIALICDRVKQVASQLA